MAGAMVEKNMSFKQENNDDQVDAITIRSHYEN